MIDKTVSQEETASDYLNDIMLCVCKLYKKAFLFPTLLKHYTDCQTGFSLDFSIILTFY